MLNLASLATSLPTNYSILISLRTMNIIPLKLLCSTFMTISPMQYYDYKKYHAFAFSISLLPLTPSTTTSYSLASHLGSVFMALFSAGSSLTYHLANFVLKCDNNLSSFHTSSCGVPQGSVLGPLPFVMCTTTLNPLIHLIFSLLLDHHLYEYTQKYSPRALSTAVMEN